MRGGHAGEAEATDKSTGMTHPGWKQQAFQRAVAGLAWPIVPAFDHIRELPYGIRLIG
jgi:hypothetical protein